MHYKVLGREGSPRAVSNESWAVENVSINLHLIATDLGMKI